MARVKAVGAEFENEAHSESGSEAPIDFGPDGDGDSTYWIDVRAYIRASLWVDPDTNGTDITVEARRTKNAPAEDLSGPTTIADAGAAELDGVDIEGYGWLRVLSNGTASDTTKAYLLLK